MDEIEPEIPVDDLPALFAGRIRPPRDIVPPTPDERPIPTGTQEVEWFEYPLDRNGLPNGVIRHIEHIEITEPITGKD
ncbi:hypothetical protein [Gordonia iterans]